MRFNVNLPCEYGEDLWKMPPFDGNGKITKRVSNGLENVPYLYSDLARRHALENENNPSNFRVKEVRLVGSGARENKILSDLDILLICPEIDEKSADALKMMISYILLCDRPKHEAIDAYIRAYDKYAERGFVDITSQTKSLIRKYNSRLVSRYNPRLRNNPECCPAI